MAAFKKTFYMANWRQGKDQHDDPNYASRTYASETSRHLALTQTLGKLLPQTEMPGHTVKLGLSQYEETQRVKAEEKWLRKKTVCVASGPAAAFTCSRCDGN